MPLHDKFPGTFLVADLAWHIQNDEPIPADLIARLADEGFEVPRLIGFVRSEVSRGAECELVS